MQRGIGRLRDWRLVFAAAALAYVGLRLAAFLPASIGSYPDSGTYIHVAEQPVWSLEFLAGSRGWTVPLFYKLLPDSDEARTMGQLAVSIVCWLTLAGVVAWCVDRRGLRPVAFCLVLLFSLSVWITQWDSLVLSESFALSLTALLFAAWLALVRAPGPWTVAAVLATTLLWTFARDSDAYFALFCVPLVVVWAVVRGATRERVVLAIGLVAIFGAFVLSTNDPRAQPRWEWPLLNVIGHRVLASESELRYFQDHGMPVPARLQALEGEQLGDSEFRPMLDRHRFAPFMSWFLAHGRSTYVTFLLGRPVLALDPVFDHPDELLAPDPPVPDDLGYATLAGYRSRGTDPLLSAPVASAVYPPSVPALLVWFGVVMAALSWLAWRRAWRTVWLVPVGALFLQIPHAAVVWHGDSNDVFRHALLVGVMARLSLLLLTILLIDAALGRRVRHAPGTGH